MSGIEPLTPCVQGRCSPWLSYIPLVGLSGFEPLTSRLSGVRSNQLSYRPPHFPKKTGVTMPIFKYITKRDLGRVPFMNSLERR